MMKTPAYRLLKWRLVIFFDVLILVIWQALPAQPTQPVRQADIPYITQNPAINGLKNESFWSAVQSTELFEYDYHGNWSGPEDFSCSFSFAWSYSYFYVFVEITDDIEHNWNGTDGNNWEFDHLDFFFQLDTCTVPISYSDNTIQIRFCRGDAGWSALPGRASPDEYLSFGTNTETGWVLEAAIPWTCVLPDNTIPEDFEDYLPLIAFDLSAFDSDNTDGIETTGNVESQLVWDMDILPPPADIPESPLWNNTAIFGYVTLIGYEGLSVANRSANSVHIYPNPARDILYLPANRMGSVIHIISADGRLVYQQEIRSASLDISGLKPGIYLGKLNGKDPFKFIKK
jgi:hypothetical protein